MDLTTAFLFMAGFVLLVVGAEALVRGASRLAVAIGISPLVTGLTVVAFGTSAPELAVSVQSVLAGQADISVGNVVGSNIFNVLLILGISAIIVPLVVAQQLIQLDVPLMIAVSVIMLLFGINGSIGRLEGTVLFLGLVAYTAFLIYQSKRESRVVEAEYEAEFGGIAKRSAWLWAVNPALIVIGLGMLVLGARWLVNGAVSMAEALGISELVIGLTIVAGGTSLPEVATSIIASIRGERDIAVGNVVGSNIFNILAVLGLSAIFAPGGLGVSEAALRFDIPVMIAVAMACLPIFFTGHVIARWEGFLFLAYYVAYSTYLILQSTQHAALETFSAVMLAFVIPLTVLTLVIITGRQVNQNRRAASRMRGS